MCTLQEDAYSIVREAIEQNLPGPAVRKALVGYRPPRGRLVVVALGKAAWTMAQAASESLGDAIGNGIVITKYHHVLGPIDRFECFEAGHPVVDEASVRATRRAQELVRDLGADDAVVLLVSGGGSALFENPKIPLDELADISRQLLACGASIEETNTIRKRLSHVKAGRFAELCAPAPVLTIALSDVLGDRLDTIASGPACVDDATSHDAMRIARRLGLRLSDDAWEALGEETPRELTNVTTQIVGSVRLLTRSAAEAAARCGYEPLVLTSSLDCEAREAGALLGAIAKDHASDGRDLAFVVGGETIVHVRGDGLGGRNQELALSAAPAIAGLKNVGVVSVGSDGTDGPTDAAGGYVDGTTQDRLKNQGIDVVDSIGRSDSYHALEACGGLVKTGPTGTNVNDVAVVLIRGR